MTTKTTNNFLTALSKTSANKSVSVTENGALGYKKTQHALTDFFYKVGSMRNWSEDQIVSEFIPVFAENEQRAMELMFFIRDCRGGQGEKRVFNVLFSWIMKTDPKKAIALLPLIPEYGSWKTFFELTPFFLSASSDVRAAAHSFFLNQWQKDYDGLCEGKPISIMAKWVPSINTSSKQTRQNAKFWVKVVGLGDKVYRQTLSRFRAHLNVLECQMAAGNWNEINYNAVPSRAGVIYRNAFLRHDEDRRRQWLESLKKNDGTAKINTGVLDVTTLAHKYMNTSGWGVRINPEDSTLEAAWKDFVEKGKMDSNAPCFIPVIDGSGSMYSNYIGATLQPIEVAMGLGLYFANINHGVWNGKVLSFGSHPEFYSVSNKATFRDQLNCALRYNDCGTTDIHKLFNLVLKTAVDNHLKQEEIPGLYILSDGEFDTMMQRPDEKLFDIIRQEWADAGYALPKLFFHNIASRTNTIPMTENSLGVGLVSGFDQSIFKMIMSNKVDPCEIILDSLNNKRYDLVRNALRSI